MQNRKGFAHFSVFMTGGLFCLLACGLGLFGTLTVQRDKLAQDYAVLAASYYQQTKQENLSADSRSYLLNLARISMEKSLQLASVQKAEDWMTLHEITKKQGRYTLSDKAKEVALQLDPTLEEKIALSHPKTYSWKPLLLTQVLDTNIGN